MPELVSGHAQTRCLVDALGDLAAQTGFAFGPASCTWEQPILVAASHQGGSEVIDVLINETGDAWLERILQLDTVFDVVVGEDEPVVRLRSVGLDQVEPELDRGQVREAHRRKRQEGNGDRELGGDSRPRDVGPYAASRTGTAIGDASLHRPGGCGCVDRLRERSRRGDLARWPTRRVRRWQRHLARDPRSRSK